MHQREFILKLENGKALKTAIAAFPFLTKGLKKRATSFSLLVFLLFSSWLLAFSLLFSSWLLVFLLPAFSLLFSLLWFFSSQLPWGPPLKFKILKTGHSPSVYKIMIAKPYILYYDLDILQYTVCQVVYIKNLKFFFFTIWMMLIRKRLSIHIKRVNVFKRMRP
jgi:hypothetical protein